MLWHRNRRATLRRTESAPPRSGRPKGDDGGAAWSESALAGLLRPVLRQSPVEFFDPEPFRRALGQPFQAAFGP